MKNKINAIVNGLPDNTNDAIRKIADKAKVGVSTVNRLYHKGASGPSIRNLSKVRDAINDLYGQELTLEKMVEDTK